MKCYIIISHRLDCESIDRRWEVMKSTSSFECSSFSTVGLLGGEILKYPQIKLINLSMVDEESAAAVGIQRSKVGFLMMVHIHHS